MAKLVWDETGKHFFETGIDQGVLYDLDNSVTETAFTTASALETYLAGNHKYSAGHAWNGLTAFNESPEGGDANDLYADNIKYLSLRGPEDFNFTIEAYTYPDAFNKYNGEIYAGASGALAAVLMTNQGRPTWGFACRTKVGNDAKGSDYGYKLHLVYGVTCGPADRSYETINDSPDAISFSWDCDTVPVEVGTLNGVAYKPTAHIIVNVVNSDTADASITALETCLFGRDASTTPSIAAVTPFLPLPSDVYKILSASYS